MRLRPQVGGGVCLAERNGKKVSKVAIGRALSLDKSLLMGGILIPTPEPRGLETFLLPGELSPSIARLVGHRRAPDSGYLLWTACGQMRPGDGVLGG